MGPDYSKYKIEELRDSLVHIKKDRFPDNYERLIAEFKNRKIEYQQYDFNDEKYSVNSKDLSELNKEIESIKVKLESVNELEDPNKYYTILKEFESKKIIRENYIHGTRKEIPIFKVSAFYKKISTDVDENKHFIKVLGLMVPVIIFIVFEGYELLTYDFDLRSISSISIIFLIVTFLLWSTYRKVLTYKKGHLQFNGASIEIKNNNLASKYNIAQLENIEITIENRFGTDTTNLKIAGKTIAFDQNTPKYDVIKKTLIEWIESNIVNSESFININDMRLTKLLR